MFYRKNRSRDWFCAKAHGNGEKMKFTSHIVVGINCFFLLYFYVSFGNQGVPHFDFTFTVTVLNYRRPTPANQINTRDLITGRWSGVGTREIRYTEWELGGCSETLNY